MFLGVPVRISWLVWLRFLATKAKQQKQSHSDEFVYFRDQLRNLGFSSSQQRRGDLQEKWACDPVIKFLSVTVQVSRTLSLVMQFSTLNQADNWI